MTRMLLRVAALALGLAAVPALGQQSGRPPARPGQDRGVQDRAAQDKTGPDRRGAGQGGGQGSGQGSGQVIGCPSLANYRMLLHDGAAAAASVLADPKADHLGCNTLSRADLTAIVDHVSLGGQSYDCAGLHGTTICHWVEAGAAARPGPTGSAKR